MTVAELIKELEQIKDKDLPVVVYDDLDICDCLHAAEVQAIYEGNTYFRKSDGLAKVYNCVKLLGEYN